MNNSKLIDIFKRRNIKHVCYFHADHFEPWSPGISSETAFGVQRFKQMAEKSRFGRRHSLFYKVHIPYRFDLEFTKTDDGLRLPDDPIVFHYRSPKENKLAETVIRELFQTNQHEMHLHAHHEWWTRNDSNYDRPWSNWVNEHSTKERDAARFELFLGMAVQTIEQEWGKPLPTWSFVHGQWALNAANPMICTISNEMQILAKYGCIGDFSFPAGAEICDPKMASPFTCRPVDSARCFDHAASEPVAVTPGSGRWGKERFFIWNSKIKAVHSSIDYYSERIRTHFEAPEEVVRCWLEQSVALDGHLFLKTHAHSLAEQYEVGTKGGVIPHAYPPFVKAFDLLERVCDDAAVHITLVTAHEVIDAFQGFAESGKIIISGAEVQPHTNAALSTDAATTPTEFDADQFQTEFADSLSAYLNEHADGEERATNYYLSKLKRHVLLEPYELGLMKHMKSVHPQESTSILEIGIGFGALSLALAIEGYDVVGFDGSRALYQGAEFIKNDLVAKYPRLSQPDALRNVFGFFPAALDTDMLANRKTNILIATNIINSTTAKEHLSILAAARHFDEVWLDVTRFGIERTTEQLRNNFLEELKNSGFDLVEVFWHRYEQYFCRFKISKETFPINEDRASSNVVQPFAMPTPRQGLKIFPSYGDLHLQACPVCRGSNHHNLWKVPLTNLKEPVHALGTEYNRLPSMQIRQNIYSFDWCSDCETIFLNPRPSLEKNRAQVSDYYVNLLKRDGQAAMFQRAFEELTQWLPAGARTIIDANAGAGAYLLGSRNLGIEKLTRYVALDISYSCISAMKADGFESYLLDIDNESLPEAIHNSADFVLFMEGFEISDDPVQAIKKLIATLRPGGRLVFSVPRYGDNVIAPFSPSPRLYVGDYFNNLVNELGVRVITRLIKPSKFIFVVECFS